MDKTTHNFDRGDLKEIDEQLKTIRTACDRLRAISDENGGIPAIERNVERIYAPLSILMGISQVLEILEEEE